MNRRRFLFSSAVAATCARTMDASSYRRIAGANGRVGLGIVGLGRRAISVTGGFLRDPRTQVTYLCDVFEAMTQGFQKQLPVAITPPASTIFYQKLLENKEVDAVLIATPDHLHSQIGSATLAAGKHVYLEKPTVHRWVERLALQKAAMSSGKVLQCGMQQRSGRHYAEVKKEFFDSGRLGSVVLVRAVWNNFPWQRRAVPSRPQPEDLHWNLFLGPAPWVPFEYVRYTSWRSFSDYGGGVLADILTHWVDVAQWMLDDSNPQSASALGGIYHLQDERINPDTVSAILQYKSWNLTFESSVLDLHDDQPAVFFEGTNGSLNLTRKGYTFLPNDGRPVTSLPLPDLEAAHTANFLDAILLGDKPNAPLETGLSATLPVQMALQSYWHHKTSTPEDLA